MSRRIILFLGLWLASAALAGAANRVIVYGPAGQAASLSQLLRPWYNVDISVCSDQTSGDTFIKELAVAGLLYCAPYSRTVTPWLFSDGKRRDALKAFLKKGGLLYFDFWALDAGKITRDFLESIEVQSPGDTKTDKDHPYYIWKVSADGSHPLLNRPNAIRLYTVDNPGGHGWWDAWSVRQQPLLRPDFRPDAAALILQDKVFGAGLVIFSQCRDIFQQYHLARNRAMAENLLTAAFGSCRVLSYDVELDSFGIPAGTIGKYTGISRGADRLLYAGNLWYQYYTGTGEKRGRPQVYQGSPDHEDAGLPVRACADAEGITVEREGTLPKGEPNLRYRMKIGFGRDGSVAGRYEIEVLAKTEFRYRPRYRFLVPGQLVVGRGYLVQQPDGARQPIILAKGADGQPDIRVQNAAALTFSTLPGPLVVEAREGNTIRALAAGPDAVMVEIVPPADIKDGAGPVKADAGAGMTISFRITLPITRQP